MIHVRFISVAPSLSFTFFVVGPISLGMLNVPGLALLRAATEQYHTFVTVPAKIDAIARAEINAPFKHPLPYGLHIAQISALNPRKRCCDLQNGFVSEIVKPILERYLPHLSGILHNFYHKNHW